MNVGVGFLVVHNSVLIADLICLATSLSTLYETDDFSSLADNVNYKTGNCFNFY